MFCDVRGGLILVAEDNPDDALLLKRAFKKAGVELTVHICSNGDEASNYLKGTNHFADRAGGMADQKNTGCRERHGKAGAGSTACNGCGGL